MSKTAGKSRRTLSGAKRSLRLNRGTLAFVLTSRAGALHRSDERPTGRGGIPSRLHRQALKETMHVAVADRPLQMRQRLDGTDAASTRWRARRVLTIEVRLVPGLHGSGGESHGLPRKLLSSVRRGGRNSREVTAGVSKGGRRSCVSALRLLIPKALDELCHLSVQVRFRVFLPAALGLPLIGPVDLWIGRVVRVDRQRDAVESLEETHPEDAPPHVAADHLDERPANTLGENVRPGASPCDAAALILESYHPRLARVPTPSQQLHRRVHRLRRQFLLRILEQLAYAFVHADYAGIVLGLRVFHQIRLHTVDAPLIERATKIQGHARPQRRCGSGHRQDRPSRGSNSARGPVGGGSPPNRLASYV